MQYYTNSYQHSFQQCWFYRHFLGLEATLYVGIVELTFRVGIMLKNVLFGLNYVVGTKVGCCPGYFDIHVVVGPKRGGIMSTPFFDDHRYQLVNRLTP